MSTSLGAHRDTPTRTHATRLPALDGLRGVAVLMVLVDHSGLLGVGRSLGSAGVTVFFVLSGFLISRVIMAARDRGDWSMRTFLAARVVRLVPALIVMQAVVAVAWFVTRGSMGELPGQMAASTAYVMNFYYGHFDARLLRHTWSLAVEEQFYLLWPLVLPWLLRARRPVIWMGVLVAASMLGRLTLAVSGHQDTAYTSLPTNAFALLLGCLLAVDPVEVKSGRLQRAVPVAAITGIVGVTLFASVPAPSILLPIAAAPLAMVALMFALPGATLLEAQWLRFVGRISYALYLWHFPVLGLADEHWGGESALPWLGLSFVLATGSTLLMEEPLRRRWRIRQATR